jgi:hypothetical protein
MLKIDVKIEQQLHMVAKAVDVAAKRVLKRAGYLVSQDAKQSIRPSQTASRPGTPPTTRGTGRKSLRSSIFYDATDEDVVVGPRFSFVGDAGKSHEFGVPRFGTEFDERPFMGPALARNTSRFADEWQGSIGQ